MSIYTHTTKSRRLQIQFVSICSSASAFSVLISLACFCVVRLWLNNCLLSGASQHKKQSNARKIIPRLESIATKCLALRKQQQKTKPLTFIIIVSEHRTHYTLTAKLQNNQIKTFYRFVSRLWMTMKREIGKERAREKERRRKSLAKSKSNERKMHNEKLVIESGKNDTFLRLKFAEKE